MNDHNNPSSTSSTKTIQLLNAHSKIIKATGGEGLDNILKKLEQVSKKLAKANDDTQSQLDALQKALDLDEQKKKELEEFKARKLLEEQQKENAKKKPTGKLIKMRTSRKKRFDEDGKPKDENDEDEDEDEEFYDDDDPLDDPLAGNFTTSGDTTIIERILPPVIIGGSDEETTTKLQIEDEGNVKSKPVLVDTKLPEQDASRSQDKEADSVDMKPEGMEHGQLGMNKIAQLNDDAFEYDQVYSKQLLEAMGEWIHDFDFLERNGIFNSEFFILEIAR